MDYAMAEVIHGRRIWQYFDNIAEEDVIVCVHEDTLDLEEEEDAEAEAVVPEPEAAVVPEPEAAEDADLDDDLEVSTGGTPIKIIADADCKDGCTYRVLDRSKSKDGTLWMQEVVTFLHQLQEKVINHIFQIRF